MAKSFSESEMARLIAEAEVRGMMAVAVVLDERPLSLDVPEADYEALGYPETRVLKTDDITIDFVAAWVRVMLPQLLQQFIEAPTEDVKP